MPFYARARFYSVLMWIAGPALGGDVLQKELGRMSDRNPAVRRQAAARLAHAEGRSAAAALESALKDSDASVRREAALALGLRGSLGSAQVLISCLKDRDAQVRQGCIRALGLIRAPQGVAPLSSELKRGDAHEKAAVLESLGHIGGPEAFGAVRDALSALRGNRRRGAPIDQPLMQEEEAIRALGRLGRPEGIPLAKEGLSSPDDRIRAVSCLALARMGDGSERLRCAALLSHPDPLVLKDAAEALSRMEAREKARE